MRHLLTRWDDLERRVAKKRVMLFLDYDGTLTSIADSPAKASIPKHVKQVLKILSMNNRCKLAIVSGRCLKDIKKRVGLNNIVYSGNHGLEIEGPNISFEVPVAATYKTILQQIKNRLKERLSGITGILLEDKGLSLSLHYRLVGKNQIRFVKSSFCEVTEPHTGAGRIKIETGKKVLEVKPAVEWDKGKAALWILNMTKLVLRDGRIVPVYIGDDVTDEHAFKALKGRGLTVFVGNQKKSHAEYYLKNTKEVFEFLKNLTDFLSVH